MQLIDGQIILQEFNPGDYIFFEEDIDYHFYIIDEGEVQIFTKDEDGKRLNLATLNAGESFGEFAMIDRTPRSASAQAITLTRVYKVSEEGYQSLLNDLPIWAQNFMKSFTKRVRQMNLAIKKAQSL